MSKISNRFFNQPENRILLGEMKQAGADYVQAKKEVDRKVRVYKQTLLEAIEDTFLTTLATGISKGMGISEVNFILGTKSWNVGKELVTKALDERYYIEPEVEVEERWVPPVEAIVTPLGHIGAQVNYTVLSDGSFDYSVAGTIVARERTYNELVISNSSGQYSESQAGYKAFKERLISIWEYVELVLSKEED